MKIIAFCVIFLTYLTCLADPPNKQFKLKWSDEFEGVALDDKKWNHIFPGEHKHAFNTPDAVSVQNGMLEIKAFTKDGIHYTGMISTEGLFESAYGYWEIKTKIVNKPGMWTDFWLYSRTVAWMKNDINNSGAEIDIFETRSVDNDGKDISKHAMHTLHYNTYEWPLHQNYASLSENVIKDGYNVYGLEWSKSGYKFYVNGKVKYTTFRGLTSKPLFIILSVEIQDNVWSGKIPEQGYNSVIMVVDWVRVYNK